MAKECEPQDTQQGKFEGQSQKDFPPKTIASLCEIWREVIHIEFPDVLESQATARRYPSVIRSREKKPSLALGGNAVFRAYPDKPKDALTGTGHGLRLARTGYWDWLLGLIPARSLLTTGVARRHFCGNRPYIMLC
jgi:hypothetical protein